MKGGLLVVILSAEDLHQLGQTDLLLDHLEAVSKRALVRRETLPEIYTSLGVLSSLHRVFLNIYVGRTHLEHVTAGLQVASQVGQDLADLIGERELWIQKLLKELRDNVDLRHQHLKKVRTVVESSDVFFHAELHADHWRHLTFDITVKLT